MTDAEKWGGVIGKENLEAIIAKGKSELSRPFTVLVTARNYTDYYVFSVPAVLAISDALTLSESEPIGGNAKAYAEEKIEYPLRVFLYEPENAASPLCYGVIKQQGADVKWSKISAPV